MHTHVSAITKKLLRQIYEKKTCPVNDLDCSFLCQDYYRLSASRGEGPSGAFVTHCYISCLQYVCYTYRTVSRVFRIPFRGGVAPEKGILNTSDIILYVFCIMAANQLCLFWIQRSSYKLVNEEWHIFVIIFTTAFLILTWRSCNTWQL